MSAKSWSKADLRRIESARSSWALEHRSTGNPSPALLEARDRKVQEFLESYEQEIVLVYLDAAASGRFAGLKAPERKACEKLAARIRAEGLPPHEPEPEPCPRLLEALTAIEALPRTIPDRSDLYERQAAFGILDDVSNGQVRIHRADSKIGDTERTWGDYPHLVSWRDIGSWKADDIASRIPDAPAALDLRGIPSQHGMPLESALTLLVRAMRLRSKGVHLVTDGHADLLARMLPLYVGPNE